QRPEMAIHLFTRTIEEGDFVPFYGDGNSSRDYTYIDDIIDGIVAALLYQGHLFRIFNLGGSSPVSLNYLIQVIEKALGKSARLNRLPIQPGDVPITYADITRSENELGYYPRVTIEEGINRFVAWYREISNSRTRELV
ncbi:MAG: GDP-mannose 4,6-dehydratase, partial [Dehalococcoidales bacterium]|nr:GDP-mannose 4,6-dehydratase [Dehalococcoidales bacterium]